MTTRRQLLRGAALGVGTLAVPGWLRRAFADASLPTAEAPKGSDEGEPIELPAATTGGHRAPADVEAALKRAQRRGRPIAVIVVPEDEKLREQREELVGGFLRHAPREKLAPLGTADVICATPSSLRRANVRVKGSLDDSALFVRIEPDGRGHAYTPKPGGAATGSAQVAAAAAALFPIDGKSSDERHELGFIASRLRTGPMPGGNWGYSEGCGYRAPADAVPTDEVHGIGCGMGSMGGTAHRFLAFYVEPQKRPRPAR